jgi:carbonic anhydrase/acetyltransferase-like protein (isoleucine patch superfamily)
MALILPVQGVSPVIGSNSFVAENSTIVGDVVIGENCSVWFNTVIRGDVNFIRIGNNSNIQDGAVIHGTYKNASTTIGSNVSVGHRAIVHGCTLRDHVLIGMGAIIMDHAVVEEFCIVAAGSVILENTVCESGYLYAGVPARKIKALTEEQVALVKRLPGNYIMYSGWFTKEAPI